MDLLGNTPNMKQHIGHNSASEQFRDMERERANAYERYVMAQFRYPNDKEAMEKERRQAIESLTPGTEQHYHLYLLDLARTKSTLLELSESELLMFDRFKLHHPHSPLFQEVFMNFTLNRLDKADASSDDGIKVISEVLQEMEEIILDKGRTD